MQLQMQVNSHSAAPPSVAMAHRLSKNNPSDIRSSSAPPRRQALCSARVRSRGRTAVQVSASTLTAVTITDLAAQPFASSCFNISTYTDVNRYGKQLWQMKEYIKNNGDFRNEDEKRICLAIAMQEDRLMAAHDEAKDGKGLATNFGLYNLSLDLIKDSGYSGDLDTSKWNNSLDHVKDATNIILDYLRGDAPRRNIARTSSQLPAAASGLNFIRGGQSGYEGYTPGGFTMAAWEHQMLSYRQAIATIVDQMARNTDLMGNNCRVDISVDHI